MSALPTLFAQVCDVFLVFCAVIHLNTMTPRSSKCEMITWWAVGMSAAIDFLFGPRAHWNEVMMNVSFSILAFEATRYHFRIKHMCKFQDRRRRTEPC